MSYDYQPPKRPLTSNGKTWGENIGHLGQWTMYGFAAKRAIEAEQRRPKVAGEDAWKPVANAAEVFVMNCAHVWVWIVHTWIMLTTVAFLPIIIAEGLNAWVASIIWLVTGLPAIILTRWCQKGFGEAKRMREGITDSRPKRPFTPTGMVAMALMPVVYLLPMNWIVGTVRTFRG